MSLCPGLRRSSSGWISAVVNGIPAGQPSITTPTPPPCDSPNVEILNKFSESVHGDYFLSRLIISLSSARVSWPGAED